MGVSYRPRVRSVLIALLAMSVLAWGLLRGSIYMLTRILESRYPPPGKVVDIGGYKLDLYCVGDGNPTVLLESGLGVTWVDWMQVTQAVSMAARVCVYDRAGYGWSDPGPKPRTAMQEAYELHALLRNGGVPGPYILVGHSFGAFIVRLFATQYPSEVAGIVLVDPSHEDAGEGEIRQNTLWTRFRPRTGIQRLLRLWRGPESVPRELQGALLPFKNRYAIWSPPKQVSAEEGERLAFKQSEVEVRSSGRLGNLPLIVITAAKTGKGLDQKIRFQAELAHLSRRGQQIVTHNSSHLVQLDDPDLVVRAIYAVRDATNQDHEQRLSSCYKPGRFGYKRAA